jgi:hypothetical protein
VAPWSAFWEHNRFAETRPALEALLNSPYARGAVTGVGVLTALAGLAELASVILSKARRRDAGADPPSPAIPR